MSIEQSSSKYNELSELDRYENFLAASQELPASSSLPDRIKRSSFMPSQSLMTGVLLLGISSTGLTVDADDLNSTNFSNGKVFYPSEINEQYVQEDFFIAKFLGFLKQQIEQRPDLIFPVDAVQLDRISQLVDGVEVD